MQDTPRPAPRLAMVAAVALVVAALAAFAWFAGSSTAGAAGTGSGGGSATSGQLQPVQSSEQAAPDDPADRDGDRVHVIRMAVRADLQACARPGRRGPGAADEAAASR